MQRFIDGPLIGRRFGADLNGRAGVFRDGESTHFWEKKFLNKVNQKRGNGGGFKEVSQRKWRRRRLAVEDFAS